MKNLLLAVAILSLALFGCPPATNALHLDGGFDGGPVATNWNFYTLDQSTLGDGGSSNLPATIPQLAMAVNSDDSVGVAFFVPKGFSASNVQLYDIHYLSWKAGVTSAPETVTTGLTNVNGVTLAFQGAGGLPAVAFLGGAYPGGSPFWTQAQAAIAYRPAGGGAWTVHLAAPDSTAGNVCSVVTGNGFNDLGLVVGLDPSLQFIGGSALLAYRDAHYGQSAGGNCDACKSDLKLASGGPTNWTYHAVDCGGFGDEVPNFGWGGHTQMIQGDGLGALVEDEQNVWETNGSHVAFRKRNSDGSWAHPPNSQTEPFGDLPGGGPNDTLSGPSLAYDSQLGYGVTVFDNSTDTLYYVESTTPMTQWSSSDPVVGSGSQGWYPSLAYDPSAHQPSIAYYFCSPVAGKPASNCLPSENSLRLATRVGTSWQTVIIDRGGALLPKLAYLTTGKRIIVYKDPFSGYLKLAEEK